MRKLGNNQLRGHNGNCALRQTTSHHPVVDYHPIPTAPAPLPHVLATRRQFKNVFIIIWQPGKGDTSGGRTYWGWDTHAHLHTLIHTYITNIQHLSPLASLACSCQLVQPDSTALTSLFTWLQNTLGFGSDENSPRCFLIWPAFQIRVIPAPYKIMIHGRTGCLISCLSFCLLLRESHSQSLRQKDKEPSLWSVGGHFR